MSISSVMAAHKTTIRANEDLECMEPATSSETDSNGDTTTTVTFDPMDVLESVCTSIDEVVSAVTTGFQALYDDLEVTNGEHVNFIVLNAYGEVFRKRQSYDFDTCEFTDRLEYSYTIGQLYQSYANGCDGEFLDFILGPYPARITEICEEYNELYEDFSYSTTPDADGNVESKATQFWNRYSAVFTEDINTQKANYDTVTADWNSFYSKIIEYKDLGASASKQMSIGSSFIQEADRAEVVQATMQDVFLNCKGKFQTFDSLVGTLYDLWVDSKAHVDDYWVGTQEIEEYEVTTYYINVYYGAMLEQVGFYDSAETLYDWFVSFFKKYSIA